MDKSLSRNPAVLAIVLVIAFLALGFIVVTSNTDMQTLTGSYFVVGAIAIATISGSSMGAGFERSLNVCCATMAAYFLIFGGISCLRHARISYSEPARFSDASGFADRLPSYLRGVHLSQVSAERIAAIDSAIRKESPASPPCWGPGLGLMTRIYGGVSSPDLPLWYHFGVTVYPSSSPALISAIEHSGCSVVICDPVWITQFPQPVVQHLDAAWIKEGNPLLIVYHRPRVAALN